MQATWNCTDASPWTHVPIACEWAVGSFPGGDDVMPWAAASQVGTHDFACNECFENGKLYFVSVRCTDQVGLTNMSVSGGLMPDLVGPQVATAATVVTRYTGRATKWWGFPSDLAIIWGFDDLESGIKTIRASLSESIQSPLSGPRDVEGLHAMPLPLSASADERHALIALRDQGITLEHTGTYYLHVCAEDRMNHTECATPYQFRVDLSPPTCRAPDDRVASLMAPEIFSQRAGYGAFWECLDWESGVSFTNFMGYGDYAPLLTRYVKTLGGEGAGEPYYRGTGSRNLVIPYVDGMRFHSCVSATNNAELYSLDACSVGTTFDGSYPDTSGPLIDEDGQPFRRNVDNELCTTVPRITDNVSSVTDVYLEVFQQIGNDLFPVSQPQPLNLSVVTQMETTVCRPMAMFQGQRYFSRLLATNGAEPKLTGQWRAEGFTIDNTEPVVGTAVLRLLYPRFFDRQADFPNSVRDLNVRVRVQGFSDDESGIAYLRVRLLMDGVQVGERIVAGGMASLSPVDMPTLPRVLNGSTLQATVTGVNRVGMEVEASTPVKLVILGSINFEDPWFVSDLDPAAFKMGAQRAGLPHFEVLQDETASIGFKHAEDPMDANAKFEYDWALTEAPCDDEDASPPITEMTHIDNGRITHDDHAWRAMPSNNDMIVPYHGGLDTRARNAIWAKTFDVTGLPSGLYCVLARACTLAVYAPDGTLALDARCKNATSYPVTVDISPPEVTVGALAPVNATGDVFPMQFPFSCDDPESAIIRASLSLGTPERPGLYIDGLTLHVVSNENGTTVTPEYEVPGLDGIFLQSSNLTRFSATALVTERLFARHRSPGAVAAKVHCVNSLSVVTEAAAPQALMDIEQPEAGRLAFPALVWSEEQDAWLGAARDAASPGLWLAWTDFADAALAHYAVCVSRDLEAMSCDVENLVLAPTSPLYTVLTKLPDHQSNGSSTTYVVTVTAVDKAGLSTSTDVVLVLDHSPPTLGNLTVGAFSPTARAGVLGPVQTYALHDTVIRLEVVGGAFDDDLQEPITIAYEAFTVDGTSVPCTYSRLSNESWVWEAHCGLAQAHQLCFRTSAVSAVGLVTVAADACVNIRLAAPVWPAHAPPVLSRTSIESQLNASWGLPEEPYGRVSFLEWALCTGLGCSELRNVQATQPYALISVLDERVLRGYTGEVWVVVTASPTEAKRRTSSVESNRLLVGATPPTAGIMTFRTARQAALADAVIDIRGFDEPVFGISSFKWCVGTTTGAADLMPCVTEASMPRSIAFAAVSASTGFQWPVLSATHTAVVTATACNSLGLCDMSVSNKITIDVDHPTGGYLRDGLNIVSEATWDDVTVLYCSPEQLVARGTPCSTSALLTGDESAALRRQVISPLRAHVTDVRGAVLQYGSSTLAAHWGGFRDAGTGVASVELCFEHVDTQAVLACAEVSPTGLAIAKVPLVDRGTYVARMVVTDRVGRNTSFVSVGAQIFSSRPQSHNVSTKLPYPDPEGLRYAAGVHWPEDNVMYVHVHAHIVMCMNDTSRRYVHARTRMMIRMHVHA